MLKICTFNGDIGKICLNVHELPTDTHQIWVRGFSDQASRSWKLDSGTGHVF